MLDTINARPAASKVEALRQRHSFKTELDDETRKAVLTAWQERKKEEITHPYLDERIPFGLIPHIQALLLARHLRGDLDAYPPFFWS